MPTPLQTIDGMNLRRFGVTPYSKPLFRVVWSDSRTEKIGGKWPDGACEYREVPRYPGIHGWVLEMWKSPEEYAGTRENYRREQFDPASGLLTCGPYPSNGEYALVYQFPFKPGPTMVETIITAIRLSRDLTAGARKQSIMDPLEKQEKERSNRFDDVFDQALGPWSTADAVVGFGRASGTTRQGFKRSGDMPHPRTDQQSPLPTAPNFFGQIRSENTIEKLTGEHDA